MEKVLSEQLKCAKEYQLYGALSYRTTLEHAAGQLLVDYAKNLKLVTDLRINPLLYTPIAIARSQKLLIEALITKRLDLRKKEWIILIEEGDVPFASLAIADFKEMYNHLVSLSQDY